MRQRKEIKSSLTKEKRGWEIGVHGSLDENERSFDLGASGILGQSGEHADFDVSGCFGWSEITIVGYEETAYLTSIPLLSTHIKCGSKNYPILYYKYLVLNLSITCHVFIKLLSSLLKTKDNPKSFFIIPYFY